MSPARVNRPTNVREKQADINKKLQLYGIATAFQNGKLPSNEQIDIALSSFNRWSPIALPSARLSAEGRELVYDFRQVVDYAKHLFLTKNEGNLLQDFIWQAQHIQGGDATLPSAPVGGTAARQHGSQALDGLRTLGTLLVTNGQFRKLLQDATILIRDMAGDIAAKTATKVKPTDEQLAQIDKPAADNIWHNAPEISPSQLKGQIMSAKSAAGEAAHDTAGDVSAAAHPRSSRDPRETVSLVREDQQRGRDSAVDIGDGAQAGAATLWQRASRNVPEGTRERAQANKERAQQYLSSKMPPERREQTIWRLRKMVVEIQGQSDYQRAVDTLLHLAETYVGHLGTLGQQSRGAVREAHTDSGLKDAEADLKLLLERFANGTSSDDLFDAINTLYRDADRDPKLKSWFQQVNTYIRKCLRDQGYIMEDQAVDEWNKIHDRGDFLLHERYRNHTDRIVDEVKFLADQFDKDLMNHRFSQSLQKLFKDLGTDDFGKATFKPHLVKDLTEIIIPSALRNLHYVPIPRIEYSNPMIDAVVENLVIESDNLMPNIIEVANDNYFRFGRRNIANKNANSVEIHVSGIQMDLRDVSYYVKKKQGTLKLTDIGVMDIFLGGSGFSFRMKLSNARKSDQQNFFKVNKVDVSIRNFNIKLKKSRHKILFRLFKPALLRILRPMVQKVLEKQIMEQFDRLDSLAFQIKKEADRAKIQARQNQEDAPNFYERYISAVQKLLMNGKKKPEAQGLSEKKVKIAMTKQDSIFPNLKLPDGISTMATEYKELGMRGERWESPVFKIGSAPRSGNIIPAPQVSRKRHPVLHGGQEAQENIKGGPSTERAATDNDLYGSDTTPGPATSSQLGAGGMGGTTAMTSSLTSGAMAATYGTGHTLLGEHNPVFSGEA